MPESTIATASDKLVLEVTASETAADAVWSKDGKTLKSDTKRQITTKGVSRKLLIHKMTPDDCGTYKCQIGQSVTTTDVSLTQGGLHLKLIKSCI